MCVTLVKICGLGIANPAGSECCKSWSGRGGLTSASDWCTVLNFLPPGRRLLSLMPVRGTT